MFYLRMAVDANMAYDVQLSGFMNLPYKQLACLLEWHRVLARTLQDNRNTITGTQAYFNAECEFRIHDLTVRCLEDSTCPNPTWS
jgi:hypothetical protein